MYVDKHELHGGSLAEGSCRNTLSLLSSTNAHSVSCLVVLSFLDIYSSSPAISVKYSKSISLASFSRCCASASGFYSATYRCSSDRPNGFIIIDAHIDFPPSQQRR